MTEKEWLGVNDPDLFWRHLEVVDPSPKHLRKTRLLACALARLAWHVHNEQGKRIIESMERYADGIDSIVDLSEAFGGYSYQVDNESDQWRQAAGICVLNLWMATKQNYSVQFVVGGGRLALEASQHNDEVWVSAHIPLICEAIRDIFGNPFHPVTLNPTWLTPTVKARAEQIYQDRAFDRMPILADALEEAGCTVGEVLEHCRSRGEHVRGCWVLDKVLGRE